MKEGRGGWKNLPPMEIENHPMINWKRRTENHPMEIGKLIQ